MADQHKPLDADTIERLGDERRLPRRRCIVGAIRSLAPAEARPIEEDHAAVRGETIAEARPQILEVAAGTMDQHHRPRRIVARPDVEDVQTSAVDVNELPRRRMPRHDARAGDGCDDRTGDQDRDDNAGNGDHGSSQHGPMRKGDWACCSTSQRGHERRTRFASG